MQIDPVPANWRIAAGRASECVLIVRRFDRAERIRRGIFSATSFLVLASMSVFLPGLHFVLVPGFLLGAIPFGIVRSRKTIGLASVSGVCPKCGAQASVDLGGEKPQASIGVFCPGCFDRLTIDVPSEACK